MPRSLEQLLNIAESTLTRARIPHALIGGCARNLYAPPRATRDVDLAVNATRDAYEHVRSELRKQGFTRLTETRADPQSATPDVALFSDDSGGRIDLLLAHTDFEERAIERARTVELESGLALSVVRVEDLIIYKALAARPRDIVDIEEVVRFQTASGVAIDWAYVEAECAQWDALDALRGPRERAQLG